MTDLASVLMAAGPYPELADPLRLYGRLVGNWRMQARLQPEPDEFVDADGTITFGWILGGRAIQDVWNLPGWFYGTTLRIFDPALDVWHILWNEPVHQYYTHMIGRPEGDGMVQLGKNKENRNIRWRFSDVAPDSFRWTGEVMRDDGTWYLQSDIAVARD